MMRAEEYSIYQKRVEAFINYLKNGAILREKIPFEATYSHSVEPVAFRDHLKGEYKPIKKGDKWGNEWDSAWFKLKAKVPLGWAGKAVAANLNFNGEACIFSDSGCPLYGMTDGSVFNINYGKDIYQIFDSCTGGEEVNLTVETAVNKLFGIDLERDPERSCPKRHGTYEGKVVSLDLVVFDNELWHLMLDMTVLYNLMNSAGSGARDSGIGQMWGSAKFLTQLTPRQKRLLNTMYKAVVAFEDNPDNAAKAREILKPLFATPANASDLKVTAVSHAHIDTGWLWPVRETIRKCARTFSSQIALIEKYPGFVFGASQPQHFKFIKDYYPELYEKVKKYVRSGNIECQGGMWVEADCNVTGGEAMIRQFIHGKNFFKDEFDVDVRNLWIPDVFGYSAAMPQIMQKCGVDFFLTQKISWSQFNEFPHNTFFWRGLDGSEVLTHFPPEDTYNAPMLPAGHIKAQNNFKESHIADEFLCLYGIGNGGGGAKEEHVEQALRQNDLEGCPKVSFGRAQDYFDRLSEHSADFERWDGELYLELHRATLTTQARTKKGNRTLERKLREAEFICSCLDTADYPQDALDRLWKVLLINQFHDILPGSSIKKVYETTEKEHAESIAECEALIAAAGEKLTDKSAESVTLVNILSKEYTAPVMLPESFRGCGAVDGNGNKLTVQEDENGISASITLPPCGSVTITKAQKNDSTSLDISKGLILENELVRYEFAEDGTITNACDKEASRSILTAGEKGNQLSLYVDRPVNWDAWDIDITYENECIGGVDPVSVCGLSDGGVRKGIKFTLKAGESVIEQSVYLNNNSKRLDFQTKVDWKELHKMLRVSFPAEVRAREASFDIQYGYAKRPTHRNTGWELAKFEVCAHRYADISDKDYGVALLNDCKYGYKVLDNVLDLNLLRSPVYPDADADLGEHCFTYSLLPHTGELTDSDVIYQAAMLNQPPVTLCGAGANAAIPVSFTGHGTSLDVLKKAEKEACRVIRVSEIFGENSSCTITLNAGESLVETDMMEWNDGKVFSGKQHTFSLKPFEILTFKIK